MQAGHMSLHQILDQYDEIIIPDIQRDYVMGSGEKKSIELFAAMAQSFEGKEKFYFSCQIGYREEKEQKKLYIYDGQQRMATLICLCSYLNRKYPEKMNPDHDKINQEEISKLLGKFTFAGRDAANEWIRNPENRKETDAIDFTTYSLAKLIQRFESPCIGTGYFRETYAQKISFEFLFEDVLFDMVYVDKISDAEQFFLDVNDGLDLMSYEVYKAELFHHTKQIFGKTEWKQFALKMENRWLNFFRTKVVKENNEYSKEIYCEEEILVFFLQYCFRMMWIEKNGNDNGFREDAVRWLEKEEIERVGQILDAIIDLNFAENGKKEEGKEKIAEDLFVRYSYWNEWNQEGAGQRWKIDNQKYIAMLDCFLKNLYRTGETKKDVIIWCFISKLPLGIQKKNQAALYEYLRLIKKLLNRNRKTCEDALCLWMSEFEPEIIYARYYLQEIPQYYLKNDILNEAGYNWKYHPEEYDKTFLSLIIILNQKYRFDEDVIAVFLRYLDFEKYGSESIKNDWSKPELKSILENLKTILEKEKKKQQSKDRERIAKYEDLPYIDGWVDNLIEEKDDSCQLKEWAESVITSAEKLNNSSKNNRYGNYQYLELLEYIYNNKINIQNFMFQETRISWKNYSGNIRYPAQGLLVVHTLYDLLTSDKGIEICENITDNSILCRMPLPDGWIDKDKKIIFQPMPARCDNIDKNGFASFGKTIGVFDLNNFLVNFSWIRRGRPGGYEINGVIEESLPYYLCVYNGDNWVKKKLNANDKIYYSEEKYLNRILLYLLKSDWEKEGKDVDLYLKENLDEMWFFETCGKKFFIKLEKI